MDQAFARFSEGFKVYVCVQENGAGDGLGTRLSKNPAEAELNFKGIFGLQVAYMYCCSLMTLLPPDPNLAASMATSDVGTSSVVTSPHSGDHRICT